VALSLLSNVKAELDQMLQEGAISEVNQPTAWFDDMVVVPKSNS